MINVIVDSSSWHDKYSEDILSEKGRVYELPNSSVKVQQLAGICIFRLYFSLPLDIITIWDKSVSQMLIILS
jgi:hypothetical protein